MSRLLPAAMTSTSMASRWWCSRSEPPDIIEDVADEEIEPADEGEQGGDRFAHAVIFRIVDVLPDVPVDRKKTEAERGSMLLELEEALGFPVAGLLDRNAHVDAVLGVDPSSHQERQDPEDTDRGSVAGRRNGAKPRHEPSRGLAHRHQHRHGLMGERAEQCDREQSVYDQQDCPERVDRYQHQSPPNLTVVPDGYGTSCARSRRRHPLFWCCRPGTQVGCVLPMRLRILFIVVVQL